MALKAEESTSHGVPAVSPAAAADRPTRRGLDWLGATKSARTRILASYVILLAVVAVLGILALRQVLLVRLEDQVNDALDQEARELDRLIVDGRDPATGEPFANLGALFDVYFARNVPSEDEALLAFVDGELHRSSVARYPLDRLPAETLDEWEALSSPLPPEGDSATGSYDTDLGAGYFRASRILFSDDTGAFIVTILPDEERDEIAAIQTIGIGATLGALFIASAIAWLITDRVLAPVRLLTEAAQSISQSDLTRRIDVRGTGEAAEMARSFNAMLDRIEAVFRGQRAFVHDASHELRDPLTICRGHLELIGDDPEEQEKTIALVQDEIDRMGRIVDDLQLLADAEQPDFLQPESISLEAFTRELLAKASALGQRHWELAEMGEGRIFADRHRLTEAVMNLAHNAVKHTTPEDTIVISTSLKGERLRITVRDSGAGITLSDQGRIFERFARGTGAHRRYRGSGLGLAIVKAIAEAHGGRVELGSRPGEGATFTIAIPRNLGEGGPGDQVTDR
jgi:two-component system, OmpR family, sensor kinase